MTEILQKIIDHPINRPVLSFLNIDVLNASLRFQKWEDADSGFDEGGTALFDKFGANLPSECKYVLDLHNLLVEPNTGEIFAFHTGRYSLFLKCDFDYFGLTNSDHYRKGYTLDCIADITALGKDWAFMDGFEGSESATLERTYHVLNAREANKE